MKALSKILTLLLLISTLKAQDANVYSSMNYYAKPGAAINISYPEIRMDLNETGDVNLTLSTSIPKGIVHITTVLDQNLQTNAQLDTNATHKIEANQKKILINFQVQAKKEGLFYIRLLTKVETQLSQKLRTFAIPVYVGTQQKPLPKSLTSSLKALGTSENISVSRAKETIEVIKER